MDNYHRYFKEILTAASKHRFFDPSSGHLPVAEAARLRVRLDAVQAAIDDPTNDPETTIRLDRLSLSISQSYLAYLKTLGLTPQAAGTSLKRISSGVLQDFHREQQETEIDEEQRRIEAEIFGDD